MPKLEPLMSLSVTLDPNQPVGVGPFGARSIAPITGGTFEGEGLKGTVVPGGADWLLLGKDGTGRLDVRLTLHTEDGANIYVQYTGILVLNDTVTEALQGGSGFEYGATRFFSQPRFETGDQRYVWLNSTFAIAQGRLVPGGVEYRVFTVEND